MKQRMPGQQLDIFNSYYLGTQFLVTLLYLGTHLLLNYRSVSIPISQCEPMLLFSILLSRPSISSITILQVWALALRVIKPYIFSYPILSSICAISNLLLLNCNLSSELISTSSSQLHLDIFVSCQYFLGLS